MAGGGRGGLLFGELLSGLCLFRDDKLPLALHLLDDCTMLGGDLASNPLRNVCCSRCVLFLHCLIKSVVVTNMKGFSVLIDLRHELPIRSHHVDTFKSRNDSRLLVELRNIKFIIMQRFYRLPTLLGFLVVELHGFP